MSRNTPEPDALDRELREAFRRADLPAAPLELRAQIEALPSSPRRVRGVPGGVRFGRWPRSSALLGLFAAAVAIAVVAAGLPIWLTQSQGSHESPTASQAMPLASPRLSPSSQPVATATEGSSSAPSVPASSPSARLAAAFREWTRIDMPDPGRVHYADGTPTGVVAFHGTYVATGSVGAGANGDPSLNWGVVWTSSDGRSWTLSDHLAAFEHASLMGLVTDGTRLIAVGTYAAPIPNELGVSVPAVWVSSDGRTWVRAPDPAPSFVAVGLHGFIGAVTKQPSSSPGTSAQFVTSTDGLTWTNVSGIFETDLRGLAAAPDGTAMAVGAVPGAPRTGGTTTVDMVVWRSANGTTWTGPETIAHDARPVAVTSDGHGFLVVVWLSALLPSGSIIDVSRVWRFVDGNGPRAAVIPLGDEEALDSIFVVGDTLLAAGDTLVDGGVANAMVWVSTDAGTTWGRVADQPAFSDINNELAGVVQTSAGLLAVGRRWDSATMHALPAVWLAGR